MTQPLQMKGESEGHGLPGMKLRPCRSVHEFVLLHNALKWNSYLNFD